MLFNGEVVGNGRAERLVSFGSSGPPLKISLKYIQENSNISKVAQTPIVGDIAMVQRNYAVGARVNIRVPAAKISGSCHDSASHICRYTYHLVENQRNLIARGNFTQAFQESWLGRDSALHGFDDDSR